MIDSSHITSSEERVDMERRANVRGAMRMLLADYHDRISRESVREHVVTVMLDSVHKQARWSA